MDGIVGLYCLRSAKEYANRIFILQTKHGVYIGTISLIELHDPMLLIEKLRKEKDKL